MIPAGMPTRIALQVKRDARESLPSRTNQTLVDRVTEWEHKAAEQYREDGSSDGWSSEASEPETAEQKYIRACHHPSTDPGFCAPHAEAAWMYACLLQQD